MFAVCKSFVRVSLALCCAVVIGAPSAMATGPDCGANPDYSVTYLGSNFVNGNTTFTYQVCVLAPPALSHFDLAVPTCGDDPRPTLVAASATPINGAFVPNNLPTNVYPTDPTTGVNGIKWDFGVPVGSCNTYTATFQGLVAEGAGSAVVKGGNGFCTFSVPGPSCDVTSSVCGDDAEADVVVMIDRTGSISSGELTQEKNAAKTLLNFFDGAVTKPRVAIGTFNVQSGPDARIQPNGSLTDAYGSPGNGLYDVIDDITTSSGRTNIGTAITVAQAELTANGAPGTPDYIIIISDGIPNEPGCAGSCACQAGYDAGSTAADAAEALGTNIFAVHFGNDSCAGEPTNGQNYLMNSIASGPAYYFDGNADLSGIFTQIAEALVCDDGNACTLDECNLQTNQCVSTPLGDDSDGDGVPDCTDQCPGADDTHLGDLCTVGVGTCANDGELVCGDGALVCSASPGQPQAEVCNDLDDNCNGQVDEGLPPIDDCTAGTGQCENPGQVVCLDGQYTCDAIPGEPGTEICDGLDNNCNGEIDEGLPPGDQCSVGVGACQVTGQLVCVDGGTVCDAEPGIPSEEICDEIDNDCDGEVDEGEVCDELTFDYLGVPNGTATLDQCGLCAGDGTSCLGCSDVNITEQQFVLDGGADAQKAQVSLLVKKVLKLKASGKTKNQVKALLTQAKGLYLQNWNLVWSLPSITTQCTNQVLCVQSDNSATVALYSANSVELNKIAKKVVKILGKLGVNAKNYGKKADKLLQKNLAVAAQIPVVASDCSQPAPQA